MPKKRCSKCKEFKDLECFSNNKAWKDGKYPQCKQCRDEYYQENKKERLKYQKKYHQEHKKEATQWSKQYYKKNKEAIREYHKIYQQKNKKKIAEQAKKYRHQHKEEIRKTAREYQQKNKNNRNNYIKNRRIIDSLFKLNLNMSKAIQKVKNHSIKQDRSWNDLVPYTLIELKKHLKKTLPEDYTWKDFMQGKLHIDHILPKAIFQYEKSEDLDF